MFRSANQTLDRELRLDASAPWPGRSCVYSHTHPHIRIRARAIARPINRYPLVLPEMVNCASETAAALDPPTPIRIPGSGVCYSPVVTA
jgi:hypothetical protein